MDLLQAYHPGGNTTEEIVSYTRRGTAIFVEMLRNGTSTAEREAWARKNVYRQMRFYRNLGRSFQELTGSENPFHDIALDAFSSCPTFVDLDKDDVLELVLGTTDGNLSLSSHSSFFIRVLHLNIFRPSSVSLEFFTCIGSFFSIFLSLKNSPHQGSCSTLSSRTAPFSASRRRLLLTCPLKVPLVRLVSSLAS